MTTHRRADGGLGLIELMVAVVVLGIIMAVAVPSFADLLNRRRVHAVAEQISTDLAYFRAETALRSRGVIIGFKESDSLSCYAAWFYTTGGECNCTRSGTGCDPGVVELKTARVPKSIGVSFTSLATWPEPIALSAGLLEFKQPQLRASPNDFRVTISGRNVALRVELNRVGRVRTCSERGSFSGVPACQ
jgi:type IV fimbrial biogenesis protein FimT